MRLILHHVARFAYRDWRAGELTLLLAALIIAVASLAAVGFFVDRLRVGLDRQATQLLGADLVVRSQREISPDYAAYAAQLGLQTASTTGFPSMVGRGAMPRLASVKAFTPGYPLRGRLRLLNPDGASDREAKTMPAGGQAWADPQLANALGARVGDMLEVGKAKFKLTELIALEPDRGGGFVNLAPRLLIAASDLEQTKLLQRGSRVTHRLLVAGDAEPMARFNQWARARLAVGERVETMADNRPELDATINKAEQFLSLVALLSALIAAVAVALAARRFAQRHLDACAVVKALGMSQSDLLRVLIGELLVVAVIGGVIGAALGWAIHFVLAAAIAPLLSIPLPAPGIGPALSAIFAALVLLLGFGAWPFVSLAGVPPLRVLRRDLGQAPASAWLGAVIALLCFSSLLFWLSSDKKIAAYALTGFAVGAVVFALLAWLLVWGVGKARAIPFIARNPVLRLAMASWSRRRSSAVAQTVALAVGLMALTLLTVTRTDLVEGWQRATPADAPNRFVINIQPDQYDPVRQALDDAGVKDAQIYPSVRGRLIEINDVPAEQAAKFSKQGEGRGALKRELNLSYMTDAPTHNTVIEGTWFGPDEAAVSVEKSLMVSLGLNLGDKLLFDIAGEQVAVTITNVREVKWDSMKVNFYMIFSPGALRDMPVSFITAFHQPNAAALDRQLVSTFPNLTVFDTGLILRQIQSLLGQVVRAVQFLFLLTLAAGIAVLYGALATSRDERVQEAGLMRALGASRKQLATSQLWELALSGALAGVMAAAGALIIGAVLADQVFKFEMALRWSMLPAGLLAGALLAVIAGWMGLRSVLDSPPLLTLRAS